MLLMRKHRDSFVYDKFFCLLLFFRCKFQKSLVGELKMPLFFVHYRAVFFVKFDGGRVPFKNLKIHSDRAEFRTDFGDFFYHFFAKPVFSVIFGDINVFEIDAFLPAKTRKIRKENRVSNRRFSVKCR